MRLTGAAVLGCESIGVKGQVLLGIADVPCSVDAVFEGLAERGGGQVLVFRIFNSTNVEAKLCFCTSFDRVGTSWVKKQKVSQPNTFMHLIQLPRLLSNGRSKSQSYKSPTFAAFDQPATDISREDTTINMSADPHGL